MELGPSTFVGIGLALIGLILYLVKTKKPDVSRDYDLFFSSVGLLCGGILIFQGWRLDPILLLCQILSSATAIFFIGESLWLRGIKSQNITLFPHKHRMEKELCFETLKLPSFGIENTDESLSSQDFLDKKVFFSEYKHEDLNLFKEKAFIPSEIQKTKDISKTSHKYIFLLKKKAYEEKKISMDYQLKNKYFDFDYTDPIDYCYIAFSIEN
jgi:hypothetical protein